MSLWGVCCSSVLALVLIIAISSRSAWTVAIGRSRAEALCAAARVGKSIAKIDAKARDSGLTIVATPARMGADGQVLPAQMIGMGGRSFARWFCMIEHADGRIVNRRVDVFEQ